MTRQQKESGLPQIVQRGANYLNKHSKITSTFLSLVLALSGGLTAANIARASSSPPSLRSIDKGTAATSIKTETQLPLDQPLSLPPGASNIQFWRSMIFFGVNDQPGWDATLYYLDAQGVPIFVGHNFYDFDASSLKDSGLIVAMKKGEPGESDTTHLITDIGRPERVIPDILTRTGRNIKRHNIHTTDELLSSTATVDLGGATRWVRFALEQIIPDATAANTDSILSVLTARATDMVLADLQKISINYVNAANADPRQLTPEFLRNKLANALSLPDDVKNRFIAGVATELDLRVIAEQMMSSSLSPQSVQGNWRFMAERPGMVPDVREASSVARNGIEAVIETTNDVRPDGRPSTIAILELHSETRGQNGLENNLITLPYLFAEGDKVSDVSVQIADSGTIIPTAMVDGIFTMSLVTRREGTTTFDFQPVDLGLGQFDPNSKLQTVLRGDNLTFVITEPDGRIIEGRYNTKTHSLLITPIIADQIGLVGNPKIKVELVNIDGNSLNGVAAEAPDGPKAVLTQKGTVRNQFAPLTIN